MNRLDKLLLAAVFILLFGVGWHYAWMSGDGWWYLALGREILDCGCLPQYNDLTFTGHWTKVLHQQWLPYVIYYGSFEMGGYTLVYAITAAFMAGAFGMAISASRERGGSVAAGIILALAGAYAFRKDFSVRSEALIDILFALEVWLVTRRLSGKRAPAWLIVLLFVIWANSHSSLPLAFAYPMVVGLGWLIDRRRGMEVTGDRRLVVWFIIACVATLLNPYGPAIYADIISRLASPSVHVIEIFKSPNFHDPYNLLQLAWLLTLWIGLIISPREIKATDLMVAGTFSLLYLNAQRYFIFMLLATLPLAAEHWSAAARNWFIRPAIKWALVGLCILGCSTLLATPRHYGDVEWPVRDAADFLNKTGFKGHIFNYYTWGGYLLWAHPELDIFIDGRNNIYEPSGVFKDYVAAARGGSWWREIFDVYDIDAVIYPLWEIRLTAALQNAPEWKTTFVSGEAAVYLRHTQNNKAIIEK